MRVGSQAVVRELHTDLHIGEMFYFMFYREYENCLIMCVGTNLAFADCKHSISSSGCRHVFYSYAELK